MTELNVNESQTLAELVGPEELPYAVYDFIRTLIRIYEAHEAELTETVENNLIA